MTVIYKILPEPLWQEAQAQGLFRGAAIDLSDGYIHFSDAGQVRETARRHFNGQTDLVLVAFEAEAFGTALRWEASRGGALFPHLYAELDPAIAKWVMPLPWDGSGHVFPQNVFPPERLA